MDLLDIRQLRTFQLLARAGSFTAVARQMFVTQSAVSHSIKALERSLEKRLLDRSGKSLALTPEGEALLRRTDRIIEEMRLATEELQGIGLEGYETMRLGSTDTMCQHLLPSALQGLRQKLPHSEVSIRTADTHELLVMLSGSEIDLAIGINTLCDSGFAFHPLFRDRLHFVVTPQHPWATGKSDPQLSLSEQRYLVYAKKSPTSQLLERYHQAHAVSPPLMELSNMEAIKELARIGMGVGVLAPWVVAEELRDGSLVAVEPPGPTPLEREWGIFTRGASLDASPLFSELLRLAQGVARSLEGKTSAATEA